MYAPLRLVPCLAFLGLMLLSPTLAHVGDGTQSPPMACSAESPFDNICTTGPHVMNGVWLLAAQDPGPDYSGILETRIVTTRGAYLIHCQYSEGEHIDGTCHFGGVFPRKGETFDHTCVSLIVRTPVRVEGGVGAWGCHVSHP